MMEIWKIFKLIYRLRYEGHNIFDMGQDFIYIYIYIYRFSF